MWEDVEGRVDENLKLWSESFNCLWIQLGKYSRVLLIPTKLRPYNFYPEDGQSQMVETLHIAVEFRCAIHQVELNSRVNFYGHAQSLQLLISLLLSDVASLSFMLIAGAYRLHDDYRFVLLLHRTYPINFIYERRIRVVEVRQ